MDYYDYYEIESTLKALSKDKLNVPPNPDAIGFHMASIRPPRTVQAGSELGSIRSYLDNLSKGSKAEEQF